MEVWYLEHSGFAVQTAGHLFIFDYYKDEPRGCGMAKGVIDPREIAGLDTVVLVSHRHPDHYNPKIFSWRKQVPQIRYVLSSDLHTKEEAYFLKPGQTLALSDLTVRALESTDLGCAFLVKADGCSIFHAGDLNWWHWDGEPEEDNQQMGQRYREQIDLLKGEAIDLAFVPVDPRLGPDKCLWGLDYLMTTLQPAAAIPMHFWGDFGIFDRIAADPRTAPYRDRVLTLAHRGQKLTL